ncbi:MAG TPA: AbrB/MazE/SpoVT family DNA-binding domain-containing protein [Caldilineaceae bacterium]|nr:AbrB/MazE/SpoVT family DNA-binding domain-containing protein [Caldilineaceae bacterium]
MQVVPQETITDTNEFVVSVSPKGQITMPKAIRTKLGVKPKDKVTIRLDQGDVKVAPVKATVDSIYQMGGALETPLSDKEMVQIAQEEQAQRVAHEGL